MLMYSRCLCVGVQADRGLWQTASGPFTKHQFHVYMCCKARRWCEVVNVIGKRRECVHLLSKINTIIVCALLAL